MGLKGNFKFWRSLELEGEVIGVDATDQTLRKNSRNRHGFALERLGDEFWVFQAKRCKISGWKHGLADKCRDLLLGSQWGWKKMTPSKKSKSGEEGDKK